MCFPAWVRRVNFFSITFLYLVRMKKSKWINYQQIQNELMNNKFINGISVCTLDLACLLFRVRARLSLRIQVVMQIREDGGESNILGFLLVYFSSVFLWKQPDIMFLVVGRNSQPPPSFDRCKQIHSKCLSSLTFCIIEFAMHLLIMHSFTFTEKKAKQRDLDMDCQRHNSEAVIKGMEEKLKEKDKEHRYV